MRKSALRWMVVFTVFMLAIPYTGLADAELYIRGDENVKKISITIDDCWEMRRITEYLDICKEYGVRTTLFPVGRAIKEEYADIWRRAVEEGHEIGNHTYSHPDLSGLSADKVVEELRKMEQRLNDVLGFEYKVKVMRPPYGALNGRVRSAVEQAGYNNVVKWDVQMQSPNGIMRQVGNGSIILFHALKEDIECIREVIPRLLEEGYEIVPVSELLGMTDTEADAATEAGSAGL